MNFGASCLKGMLAFFFIKGFMFKKRFKFSTTQIILFSFLITILIGSVFLSLPISSSTGKSVAYIDALFTATTSTCVTGLVTVPVYSTWSVFGQIIILILIQVGGLGIITIMSGVMLLINKKMGISDRLLIQDSFNLNTMSGLSKFVKNVLIGTLIIEGIGAVLYMFVFVPDFGVRGVWVSVFTSVSAFCNAGIDIIGFNSLCDYATNPLVNSVTSILIILGGLGYIVWWDVIRVLKTKTRKNRRIFRNLTLHSKIAITASLGLIFIGALLLFIFEYSNSLTIANLSLFDKIQVSLFQSITTRTAGFASIPQESLRNSSALICIILMFIGGSPVGTAGGIKTVTLIILVSTAFSTIRNRNSVTLFGRSVSNYSIKKAVAVFVMFIVICVVSTLLLTVTNNSAPFIDVLYESVSASATVGLSRNFTSSINFIGKWIIIITMYLGRVGPISLAIALGSKNINHNIVSDPIEEINIG